mgnify:FL=1|tara:strand:- start:1017 stop:1892 length:876 start_codon:yes stop_codon:yes gene_type:complete
MSDILSKFKQQINDNINSHYLIHGNNILAKINNNSKIDVIERIIPQYNIFKATNNDLVGYTDDIINRRVISLNIYYNFLKENSFDRAYTSQSKFRPTILEEFMYYIFRDFFKEKKDEIETGRNDVLKLGSIKAYTNLYFKAKNVAEFINTPQIGINEKDQDFSIYRTLRMKVEGKIFDTNIPIISLENKTYLDKTMLEGSVATAEKIKSGNPYSFFGIVTETYDVSFEVDPAYSRIDQIYVLRKSKRRDAEKNEEPIHSEVFIRLFNDSKYHFEKSWSDIEVKMINEGIII